MILDRTSFIRAMRPLLAAFSAFIVGAALLLHTNFSDLAISQDGKIRAVTISLASDISGRIDKVYVRDNQIVRKGDLLFSIDHARLQNAVDRANATLAVAELALEAEQRKNGQHHQPGEAAAVRQRETRTRYAQAVAELHQAKLELERSDVVAPANGIASNLSLRSGAYAFAREPVLALVDTDSYYVEGCFEESTLARMRAGARIAIHVTGGESALSGRVQEQFANIGDHQCTSLPDGLLANVMSSFSWTQPVKVPVRISLDQVPAGMSFLVGRTVALTLDPEADPAVDRNRPYLDL